MCQFHTLSFIQFGIKSISHKMKFKPKAIRNEHFSHTPAFGLVYDKLLHIYLTVLPSFICHRAKRYTRLISQRIWPINKCKGDKTRWVRGPQLDHCLEDWRFTNRELTGPLQSVLLLLVLVRECDKKEDCRLRSSVNRTAYVYFFVRFFGNYIKCIYTYKTFASIHIALCWYTVTKFVGCFSCFIARSIDCCRTLFVSQSKEKYQFLTYFVKFSNS